MVECKSEAVVDFQRKCELLNVPRSSMYYKPKPQQDDDRDALIMNELRTIYDENPCYGYRKMTVALRELGMCINHKKVQNMLKLAGIQAIHPPKKTTIRNKQHEIFPYLLKDLKIERPNQVWQVDITYIKIGGHFVYLVCLIDVFSRRVMGSTLSITLDTAACLEALANALEHHKPEIVNSDQGCQFTSEEWVKELQGQGILISMDGKGRWVDNVYVERLWRTIKYECVHIHDFETVAQAREIIVRFINFYNNRRFHQSLNYHTPDAVFRMGIIPTKQELYASFASQHNVQLKGAFMF
jgi:putative transposase